MKRLFTTLFILVLALSTFAQRKTVAVQKKILTHDVYDGWKEVTYKSLSPDGQLRCDLLD
jgi:hypothetical protein